MVIYIYYIIYIQKDNTVLKTSNGEFVYKKKL